MTNSLFILAYSTSPGDLLNRDLENFRVHSAVHSLET